MDFEKEYKLIRREAAAMRRLHRQTKEGRYMMMANALHQYALRVKAAVPSDPTEADVRRLLLDPEGPIPRIKGKFGYTKTLSSGGRIYSTEQYLREAGVVGHREHAVMLDDYSTFIHKGGQSWPIAERPAGKKLK